MNEPETLTPDALAQRWGMDPKTLGNWRVKKHGPAYIKLGRGRGSKIIYRLDDVRRWEMQQRVPVNEN